MQLSLVTNNDDDENVLCHFSSTFGLIIQNIIAMSAQLGLGEATQLV